VRRASATTTASGVSTSRTLVPGYCGGTGYARPTAKSKRKVCYKCCAKVDREYMRGFVNPGGTRSTPRPRQNGLKPDFTFGRLFVKSVFVI